MPAVRPLEQELESRLLEIRESGLWRELRRVESPTGPRLTLGGHSLLNLSSNDYLGLAHHPALAEAAAKATRDYGAGSGASRLICGSLPPHHRLEECLAEFKHCEAALSFSSGYAAALGTITALVGPDDVVILDQRVHACCVDAARLSGAKLRVFAHNDLGELEDLLKWARERIGSAAGQLTGNILVVTESVFSMDGDCAPLSELMDLKDRYGAWLMLDEAHAMGVLGPTRRGLAEQAGVAGRVEIQFGTLGKAAGASGGFVAGSRRLVDFLINRARSFIFSTAPIPAAAAVAEAGVRLIASEEGAQRHARLWDSVRSLSSALRVGGLTNAQPTSAVFPLMVGDETAAVERSAHLREAGFFVPAVRFPTVARGAARLRLAVTAEHDNADLLEFADVFRKAAAKP
jgi:8-amino-7-oxononanoate synthase